MANPWKDDPFREYFSHFVSGLEHVYNSLLQFHFVATRLPNSKTRSLILSLACQCLALQTLLNIIVSIIPQNCTAFSQLFYPGLLLFRYLRPTPWDDLFMHTVRALGCETRSDMVARPGPRYFVQLRQYLRRTFKAYIVLGSVHWLVNRTGFFAWPCILIALVAVQQYLHYRGVRHSITKLIALTAFVGPRWAVWCVQTLGQQELFLYELMQPYLVRVQFKSWEERAWWKEHRIELQGFAMGVWLLCSIPVVGAAAIPVMCASVVFFLSRACGLMENSVHGLSGDLLEQRNPGLKAVALGKHPAVSGDWEAVQVETFIRSEISPALQRSYKQFMVHARIGYRDGMQNANFYYMDRGIGSAVDEDQIRADKEIAMLKKREQDRYRELSRPIGLHHHHQQQQQQQQQQQSYQDHYGRQQDPLGTLSTTNSDAGFNVSPVVEKDPSATTTSIPATSETQPPYHPEDLTQYVFSDRKTIDTAPSAPPAPPTPASPPPPAPPTPAPPSPSSSPDPSESPEPSESPDSPASSALSFIPPLLWNGMQGWTDQYQLESAAFSLESLLSKAAAVKDAAMSAKAVLSGSPWGEDEIEHERETRSNGRDNRTRSQVNRETAVENGRQAKVNRKMAEGAKMRSYSRTAPERSNGTDDQDEEDYDQTESDDLIEEEDRSEVEYERIDDVEYEEDQEEDINDGAERIAMRARKSPKRRRPTRPEPKDTTVGHQPSSGLRSRRNGDKASKQRDEVVRDRDTTEQDTPTFSRRSKSETKNLIHKALPLLPSDKPKSARASSIPMQTMSPATASATPSTIWASSSQRRLRAPWTRRGLSAIVAQNILDIEESLDKEMRSISKKMWKKTPHRVASPPSSPSPSSSTEQQEQPDQQHQQEQPILSTPGAMPVEGENDSVPKETRRDIELDKGPL